MVDWNIIGRDAYLKTGEHKGKVGKVHINDQVKYYLRYKGDFNTGHEGRVIIPSDIPPYVLIIVDNQGNVICVVGSFREDLSVIGVDNEYQPCGRSTNSGGAGVTETYHSLPNVKGKVDIRYSMFTVPDQIDIYLVHGDDDLELVYTTGQLVSGSGLFTLDYDPNIHPNTLMIRMTGHGGTIWRYTVNCPVPEEFQ